MFNNEEIINDNIIGYCKYCHNEIYSYDTYITVDGDKYHIECYEIEHSYFDPYEIDEG